MACTDPPRQVSIVAIRLVKLVSLLVWGKLLLGQMAEHPKILLKY